ncbi:MAG TPA: hypothetical protein VNK04_15285 [Gemmataceae bacterium]|nr:hypothetical protein [Gemmataceae bacterium]
MTTVKARFDGRVFIPEQPVKLPAGSIVEIPLPPTEPPAEEPTPLMVLARLLEQFPSDPDWPEDAAAQHDHYLYGTPKRP